MEEEDEEGKDAPREADGVGGAGWAGADEGAAGKEYEGAKGGSGLRELGDGEGGGTTAAIFCCGGDNGPATPSGGSRDMSDRSAEAEAAANGVVTVRWAGLWGRWSFGVEGSLSGPFEGVFGFVFELVSAELSISFCTRFPNAPPPRPKLRDRGYPEEATLVGVVERSVAGLTAREGLPGTLRNWELAPVRLEGRASEVDDMDDVLNRGDRMSREVGLPRGEEVGLRRAEPATGVSGPPTLWPAEESFASASGRIRRSSSSGDVISCCTRPRKAPPPRRAVGGNRGDAGRPVDCGLMALGRGSGLASGEVGGPNI